MLDKTIEISAQLYIMPNQMSVFEITRYLNDLAENNQHLRYMYVFEIFLKCWNADIIWIFRKANLLDIVDVSALNG